MLFPLKLTTPARRRKRGNSMASPSTPPTSGPASVVMKELSPGHTGLHSAGPHIDLIDGIVILLASFVTAATIGVAVSLFMISTVAIRVVAIPVFLYGIALVMDMRHDRPFLLKKWRCRVSAYSAICVLFSLGVSLFLFGKQFEYSSLWGDVGVYTNVASYLRAGGRIPFAFENTDIDLGINDKFPVPDGMINSSKGGGWQYHGLPTWPGLMSVSRLPNDGTALLAILYGINIFLFFTVTRIIVKDERASLASTVLLGILPLGWHQSLYATTEMLLFCIVISTAFLTIKLKFKALHLGMGLLAFGVAHSSVILLAPTLSIILSMLGMRSGRQYVKIVYPAACTCALAACMALLYAYKVSDNYTGDTVHALFGERTYLAYVACLSPVLAFAPAALTHTSRSWSIWLSRAAQIVADRFSGVTRIAVLMFLAIIIVPSFNLGWSDRYLPQTSSQYNSWSARVSYVNKGFVSLKHLSIVNICWASGILGVLGFLVESIRSSKNRHLPLLWTITAVLLIMYSILRIDIPNNYYGSRYFFPLLTPSLLIFSAYLFKRSRPTMFLMIPVIAISMMYNTALVGQHFFQGDHVFRDKLRNELWRSRKVVFFGSDWLRFHVAAQLFHPSRFAPAATSNHPDSVAAMLVTDEDMILGGHRESVQFVERRIPWQIDYLTAPELIHRKVNFVSRGLHGADVYVFEHNTWLVEGNLQCIVVSPLQTRSVRITIQSAGWWVQKPPFKDNASNLNPMLTVCGDRFALSSLSKDAIVFEGTMSADYCLVEFETNTFIPAELGEGSDRRKLGVDVASIKFEPITRLE